MTTEQRLTTRQEWAAWSDEVQADVNRVLGGFAGEIEIANDMVRAKFETDAEEAYEYALGVKEYLNDSWPYHNDQFMVVGEWYKTTVGYNSSGLAFKQEPESAFDVAWSNGFEVKLIEDEQTGDEIPTIGMSFVLSTHTIQMPVVQGKFQPLAFARLNDISIQYRRPSSGDVVSSSLEEIHHALTTADALLYLHTNHEASSFYRQSAHKQQQFLRRIIDSVIDVMPLPETSDELILHDAKTKVIYAKEVGREGVAELTPNHTQKGKFRITGEVIGVTIPDVLSDGPNMQYSHPDEFAAAGSGLGLILDIHQANFPPLELNEPTFVLPIRAIKKMRLSLR